MEEEAAVCVRVVPEASFAVAVIVYPVMADPEFCVEAVQETLAWPFPYVAETFVGCPGRETGV